MSKLTIGIIMTYDDKHNLVLDKTLCQTYGTLGTIVGISPFTDEVIPVDVLVLPTIVTVNNSLFGRAPVQELDYKNFGGDSVAIFTKLLPKYMQTNAVIIAGGSSFYAVCAIEGCTLEIYSEGGVNKTAIPITSLCESTFEITDGIINNMTIYKPCVMNVVELSSGNYVSTCHNIKNMSNYNCLVSLHDAQINDDGSIDVIPISILHKTKPIIAGLVLPEPEEIIEYMMSKYKS